MNLTTITFQEFFYQLRSFLHLVLPAVGVAIVLVGILYFGIFIGKYIEQKRILKHLPQVVSQEVMARQERIQALESELTALRERYTQLITMSRSAQILALKIDETFRLAFEDQHLKLLSSSQS